MSFWATAMVAAKTAVMAPTQVTTLSAVETVSVEMAINGYTRATRNTPAATMVAAWMRALTGVGPSMASGSHTYRGICADLPMAPMNSRRAMAVRTGVP